MAKLNDIHWLGSHLITEILPVPQTVCCRLSESHRNWSVFYQLTDVIAWRNMGESQNELQGFLVPIPPW